MTFLRWLEVDLRTIKKNVRQIKKVIGREVNLMAVIKANAYGHGLIPVAKAVIEAGAKRLAVFSLDEALKLRAANIKVPILILGYVNKENLTFVAKNDLILSLYDIETAKNLSKLGGAKIHLKIDTGMNRLGILPEEVADFINTIQKFKNLKIEGVFSHFSDPKDEKYSALQLKKFNRALSILKRANVNPRIIHLVRSDALEMKAAYFNYVRCGIALYGFAPFLNNEKPTMSLKAKIISVKEIPKCACIGYLKTYKTKKPAKVAVVGAGYADGYDRGLSNCGEVLIKGVRCPVIGLICMNQTITDVSKLNNVKIGDVATLIGEDGSDRITIGEIAKKLNTNYHEIMSRIPENIPKVYKK